MPNQVVLRGSRAESPGGGARGFWLEDQWQGTVGVEESVGVVYECVCGRVRELRFHVAAEAPDLWPCVRCGADAVREGVTNPKGGKTTPHSLVREGAWYTQNHRNEVFKRRSVKELQELLAERLAVRRSM